MPIIAQFQKNFGINLKTFMYETKNSNKIKQIINVAINSALGPMPSDAFLFKECG